MINLESKISQTVGFVGTAESLVGTGGAVSVVIECGTAIVTFVGTNETDWNRDTLTFPVARSSARPQFISAAGSASLGSFGTIAPNLGTDLRVTPGPPQDITIGPLAVLGGDATMSLSTTTQSILVPSSFISLAGSIPALGCAVDSARVSYSDEASHPVISIDVAVFGKSTLLLRISYTAHVLYTRSTEPPVVQPFPARP